MIAYAVCTCTDSDLFCFFFFFVFFFFFGFFGAASIGSIPRDCRGACKFSSYHLHSTEFEYASEHAELGPCSQAHNRGQRITPVVWKVGFNEERKKKKKK